ncbi:hypothetical protein [Actinomadura macrotermitis]|uniref:Uncharacterized protein n=1 Tax=Actinomadura macrotermitis TaxID=2585200 RepID=A0A7K0C6I2_9ACTN|nr:hypothetical protein [Actinomadura macrotermitis]MQY09060.1 hypothetical protein [Actinomadura macrotermitis]
MRIGSLVLLLWLVIGAIAAGQRHYYTRPVTDCSRTGTILVTIVAGPLNYVGLNPKISCKTPEPSK